MNSLDRLKAAMDKAYDTPGPTAPLIGLVHAAKQVLREYGHVGESTSPFKPTAGWGDIPPRFEFPIGGSKEPYPHCAPTTPGAPPPCEPALHGEQPPPPPMTARADAAVIELQAVAGLCTSFAQEAKYKAKQPDLALKIARIGLMIRDITERIPGRTKPALCDRLALAIGWLQRLEDNPGDKEALEKGFLLLCDIQEDL